MNIKITYNWLRDHLDTDATVEEIQKYLSLCGPSVERVERLEDDQVLDIEITSNRVDSASVMGVAREAQAILPQFGKKAVFTPFAPKPIQKPKTSLPLTIQDPDTLCRRVLGVVLEVKKDTPTPAHIKKRLEICGIRSLGILIDITNFVMLETGHPTHVFDYDRIKTHTLILRKAKKREKTTTLDEKTHELNEHDIVIEDGKGEIIDLPGIMGTANSVVTPETTRILFFIENNDPSAIRKTSMRLGIRTDAATINDKGPDPELALLAFQRGIELYQQHAQGTIASDIVDLYPHPRKETEIHTYLTDIQRVMGIAINEKKVIDILTRLQFGVKQIDEEEMAYPDCVKFIIRVPTWRIDDVRMKEDIAEEVARVYGYSNLPSEISPMVYIQQPVEIERLFSLQHTVKHHLKSIGLHEILNYSLVSEKLLRDTGADPSQYLKLKNTISTEIEYLRQSLIPSLIQSVKKNQGKRDILRFFEIAKVYHPMPGELPEEKYHIAIIVNTSIADLKGIIESLFRSLHLPDIQFSDSKNNLFSHSAQSSMISIENGTYAGILGSVHQEIQTSLGIKQPIFSAELDFQWLLNNARTVKPYKEPEQYAVIKLDATFKPGSHTFQQLVQIAKKTASLVHEVEYLSTYEDNITLRFYFTSRNENITEEIAKKQLLQILEAYTK